MQVKVGAIKPIAKMIDKHAWGQGIGANGDVYHRFHYGCDPEFNDMDCYFQFNIFNPYNPKSRMDRVRAYRNIASTNKPVVVWEEGNLRQCPQYKKLGWHTYLSSGNFNNANVDGTRWNKICNETGLVIKSWSSSGDEILIMGQIEYDSALIGMYDQGYNSFFDWVVDTIKTIREHSDRVICIRPHPITASSFKKHIASINKQFENVYISENLSGQTTFSGGSGLYLDLAKAHCVVTYTSNSAVEAACEGIPIFVLSSESAAYPIAHHNLADIENLNYNIDTTNWAHKIAYTLWTAEEIAAGETWAHLKPVYFS